MKKILALFTLAAVCCMAGCSYTAEISENDERLRVYAGTEYEQYSLLGARAAVYKGKYDIVEVDGELDIGSIVAPVGEDSFIAARRTDKGGEYGIYSPNGEYRTILQRYADDTESRASFFITCNEEYALYYTANINDYGAILPSEPAELHLLKLGDLTDKRIRMLDEEQFSYRAVICDNAVYFEQHIPVDDVGAYEGKYSEYAIIRYDIETERLEKYCVNAGRPVIYKDKPAFFIGDGKLVSCAEPLFEPEEHGLTDAFSLSPSGEMGYSYYKSDGDYGGYRIMGYIKDGEPFDILAVKSVFGIEDAYFSDGCAVWSNYSGYYDVYPQTLPMFYSEKRNSVVVVDDEKAYYESFISGGRIYFFGYDSDSVNRKLRNVLILDADKV